VVPAAPRPPLSDAAIQTTVVEAMDAGSQCSPHAANGVGALPGDGRVAASPSFASQALPAPVNMAPVTPLSPGLPDTDLAILRDPVSTRIASAAASARAALPPPDAAALAALSPQRLRLLPRLHALAGDSGAVADTQVALVASIHGLIVRLEDERGTLRRDLAARCAEVAQLRRELGGVSAAPKQNGRSGAGIEASNGVIKPHAAGEPNGRVASGGAVALATLGPHSLVSEAAQGAPERSQAPAQPNVAQSPDLPLSTARWHPNDTVHGLALAPPPADTAAAASVASETRLAPVIHDAPTTPPRPGTQASAPATPATASRGWFRGLFGSRRPTPQPSLLTAA
jgi:hypothetical protein